MMFLGEDCDACDEIEEQVMKSPELNKLSGCMIFSIEPKFPRRPAAGSDCPATGPAGRFDMTKLHFLEQMC